VRDRPILFCGKATDGWTPIKITGAEADVELRPVALRFHGMDTSLVFGHEKARQAESAGRADTVVASIQCEITTMYYQNKVIRSSFFYRFKRNFSVIEPFPFRRFVRLIGGLTTATGIPEALTRTVTMGCRFGLGRKSRGGFFPLQAGLPTGS
jgi:hypothetical protein